MTVRELVILMENLPDEARLPRRLLNTLFNSTQHLLADILDTVNQIAFQTSISASSAVGKEYKKVMKERPKPIERPKWIPDPPKKPKFLSGKELRAIFEQKMKKQVIAHTQSCVDSKINEGGGEVLCGCPPKIID